MILTIEMPDETFVKLNVLESATLRDIASMLRLKNPVFFCERWKGELGTLMAMYPTHEPIQKFNTNAIVLIDRYHIQEKDVPRYYMALTNGW
jgi:hypothetical protein